MFAFCRVSISPLRADQRDASEQVSQALFGEVVTIIEETEKWLFIETQFDNYQAWVDKKQFLKISEKEAKRWLDGIDYLDIPSTAIITPWGKQTIYAGSFVPYNFNQKFKIGNHEFEFYEHLDRTKKSLIEQILPFLNTPYLWGGKTSPGIDCSGFTQLIFRLQNINLPRDAYQQEELGINIPFDDKTEGDLAFFCNSERKITHVGICLSDNKIAHASSFVKIENFKADGIYNELNEKTHELFSIKRLN